MIIVTKMQQTFYPSLHFIKIMKWKYLLTIRCFRIGYAYKSTELGNEFRISCLVKQTSKS